MTFSTLANLSVSPQGYTEIGVYEKYGTTISNPAFHSYKSPRLLRFSITRGSRRMSSTTVAVIKDFIVCDTIISNLFIPCMKITGRAGTS